MFKPSSFDTTRKYPIVNALYSCPILGSVISRGRWYWAQWGVFSAAYGLLGDAQSLAELGFIVVMIDGTGTPLRSRAFGQAHYGDYGDANLPDQIAGMKELARRHSWIDIDRVGIYGHSHGGYATARALFLYPEFFKVGIAMGGVHDPASYADEYFEKLMGPMQREADGTSNYDSQSNLEIAGNLQGRLLLVHGMMDDNCAPYHTLLLAKALIEANKDFDLLLLPDSTHDVYPGMGAAERYLERRIWDYFVRHLLCVEPPREYRMRAPTG